MKKVLFVVHDASRTGAPIVLLHLLEWIKANTDVKITCLILKSGEMDGYFSALADVVFWNEETYQTKLPLRLMSRLHKIVYDEPIYQKFPKKLAEQPFDLIYINTVAATSVIPLLKRTYNCPVICHIHENSFTINNHYSDSLTTEIKSCIDRFIAVSDSTKDNLTAGQNISADKITVCRPFISVKQIREVSASVEATKKDLGITNEFVAGGSGLTTWRKGIDWFIRLAFELNRLDPDNRIKLIWVGQESREFKNQKNYELRRLGIEDRVIFTGSLKNPQNVFQIFDVFTLTSREDPFPLVCLEAASLNKPILCFDKSGGMPELVAEGAGKVIQYGDVAAMAAAIVHLAKHRSELIPLGAKAKELVTRFDVDAIAPRIFGIMQTVVKEGSLKAA